MFENKLYELYKGDCLEVMKDFQDNSVDLVLCDLPYGTTDIRGWDKIVPMDKLWYEYNRIIKENGNILLFGSQPFTSFLVLSNPKMFRYEWIWNKEKGANFLNSNHQPLKIHENVLVFSKLPTSPNKKGSAIYNPQKTDLNIQYRYSDKSKKRNNVNGGETHGVENKVLKGKMPVSIQIFKKDKDKYHPTQKPVELLEYLVKTYTNEDMIVLDNTMGSGSTGVACMNTNRRFIGIELDDKYFDIAKDRIEDAYNQIDKIEK